MVSEEDAATIKVTILGILSLSFCFALYWMFGEPFHVETSKQDKVAELVNRIINKTEDNHFSYRVTKYETEGTKRFNRTFTIELIASQKLKIPLVEKELPYGSFWPHLQCLYDSYYMFDNFAKLFYFKTEEHKHKFHSYKIFIKLTDSI